MLGAGLLFALRQWGGGVHVPETAFTPAGLPAGDLPAVALPLVAAVLGGFFELDNTAGRAEGDAGDAKRGAGGAAGARKRVASESGNGKGARVSTDDGEADEGAAVAAKRAKR